MLFRSIKRAPCGWMRRARAFQRRLASPLVEEHAGPRTDARGILRHDIAPHPELFVSPMQWLSDTSAGVVADSPT